LVLLHGATHQELAQARQHLGGLMMTGEATTNAPQALKDIALGALTAPFTAAPDILGIMSQFDVSPTLNSVSLSDRDPIISGDPIREAVGLDPDSIAGMLGEFADPTNVASKGLKLLFSAGEAISKSPEGLSLAIAFFHGTGAPRLQGNNFNLDFIGTGEGVQVRGHGIYLAEREGIGRHYQNTLGGDVANITTPTGDMYALRNHNTPGRAGAFVDEMALQDDAAQITENISAKLDKDISEEAVLTTLESLQFHGLNEEKVRQAMTQVRDRPIGVTNLSKSGMRSLWDDSDFAVQQLEVLDNLDINVVRGTLMKVDIDDIDVEGFVDLDGQMFKQPQNVQDVFENASFTRNKNMGEVTDEEVFSFIARGKTDPPTVTERIFEPDEINKYTGEQAYRILGMRLAARSEPRGSILTTKEASFRSDRALGDELEGIDTNDLLTADPELWFRISGQDKVKLQKLATDYLLENGIDGMKFRDAASRTMGQGGFLKPLTEKRTNNLVLFNPELVRRIENVETGEIIRDVTK
jgi:hypothetical protein